MCGLGSTPCTNPSGPTSSAISAARYPGPQPMSSTRSPVRSSSAARVARRWRSTSRVAYVASTARDCASSNSSRSDMLNAQSLRPAGTRPGGQNPAGRLAFPAGRARPLTQLFERRFAMRAVEAIMECLKAEGVDTVFGIPGGANLPTYDALYDAGIRHVQCRHEQGAGHAAEGYAKASGRVGVALATSGPGATNLVTPIADAMMDSVPTVFLTGQVRTELLGTDGFQEADISGITMPIVKHSIMIQDPREIPRAIHEAFHIARSGRPGPVLVDVPQDLSPADIPYEPVDGVSLPGYQPTTEGNAKQIRLAAKALANSRRPVIYAGGGVVNADAGKELVELCTSDRFPVTCTLMGLGAFPGTHDQWLGMLGMHGLRAANYAMDEADLICAIGARFDDRITGKLSEFAPRAKFIHIDVDPAEISKNVPAHIPIVGDAKNILPRLTAEYRSLEPEPGRLEEWWSRIRSWRERHPLGYEDSKDNEIKPQFMVEAVYEATGGDAIVTSDVGQHQMWTAQYYHFSKPRKWINSGGLGTMGFGLPAAMGAAVGVPDRVVCCIAGDGSVQMNMQELA